MAATETGATVEPEEQVGLQVRDVETYYGESHVLHGASLRVPEGVVASLLGRNGMGKTTLVRSITGLTPPRHGEVLFKDQPITGLPPYRIARLGIILVPQGRRVFGSLRTKQNLTLPASRVARRRRTAGSGGWDIQDVFDLFPQLAERQSARARNLSGGEAQMLAIGRALMANPKLLIMDEPSEGLAPVVIEEIQRVILELKQQGLTVLLVEQNLELAMAVSDRTFVLYEGKIVYAGSASEFSKQKNIQTEYLGV